MDERPRKLQVGWIGRLTAIKAPLLFLEVGGLIHSTLPASRFFMVGDGEMRPDCEACIRGLDLREEIQLRGWREDLESVFAGLDLLILTSINEGTPLALLEAMASGRPFVATDVGGVRDLMSGNPCRENGWERFDNGLLVPRDPVVIAAAAVFLLRRPEMRLAMGKAGREFVTARFSHTRLADDLEELYSRLAKEKHIQTGASARGELYINDGQICKRSPNDRWTRVKRRENAK